MIVAAWGLTTDWSESNIGGVYAIKLSSRGPKVNLRNISKGTIGNLDGLELSKDGNFIVSDWVSGTLYQLSPSGVLDLLLQDDKGMADIGYDSQKGIVFIPYMLNNEIMAILPRIEK